MTGAPRVADGSRPFGLPRRYFDTKETPGQGE
jgi:hypothetical protein